MADAAQAFGAAGAVVEPLEPFLTDELLDDLDTFWRVRSWNDFRALAPEGQDRVLPFIRRWVEAAADVTGREVLACYQSIMDIQRRSVAATLPFDVVLSPVAPVPAFPAEWPMPFGDHDRGMVHIGFTAPANMSGQPSISVNAGFTDDGRTIGLAITGRRFDDIGVLRAAAWWEATRPDSARPDWPIGRRATTARVRPTDAVTSERQLPDDVRRDEPDAEQADAVVRTAAHHRVAPVEVGGAGHRWARTSERHEHPEAGARLIVARLAQVTERGADVVEPLPPLGRVGRPVGRLDDDRLEQSVARPQSRIPRAPTARSRSPTMRSSRSAVISESVTGRRDQSAGRSSKVMPTSLPRASRMPARLSTGPRQTAVVG